MFLKQQISMLKMISEGSVRTGVLMLKMQLWITGINCILKYIQIKKTVVLNTKKIKYIFVQIKILHLKKKKHK